LRTAVRVEAIQRGYGRKRLLTVYVFKGTSLVKQLISGWTSSKRENFAQAKLDQSVSKISSNLRV